MSIIGNSNNYISSKDSDIIISNISSNSSQIKASVNSNSFRISNISSFQINYNYGNIQNLLFNRTNPYTTYPTSSINVNNNVRFLSIETSKNNTFSVSINYLTTDNTLKVENLGNSEITVFPDKTVSFKLIDMFPYYSYDNFLLIVE
jgi:hypothetical protein